MLAAHPLIGRPSLNNWAGVSGKGNRFKKNGGQIKRQKDIDHYSPKYTPIICHLCDPPHFSLVTTFKVVPDLVWDVHRPVRVCGNVCPVRGRPLPLRQAQATRHHNRSVQNP
jgi:hypothetical protein